MRNPQTKLMGKESTPKQYLRDAFQRGKMSAATVPVFWEITAALNSAVTVLGEAKPNLAYISKMFGFEGKSGFAKKNLGFGPEQKNQGREPERRKKPGFIKR